MLAGLELLFSSAFGRDFYFIILHKNTSFASFAPFKLIPLGIF
jgi:hypothetical protein